MTTLNRNDWLFILDSLNDRLENISDLNIGPYGMEGGFDEDIAHCESIIATIEKELSL